MATNAFPLFSGGDGIFGGSEVQLYLLAKEMSKDEKFDVSFVVGDYGQQKYKKINNVRLFKSFNPQRGDNILKQLINAFRYLILFKRIDAQVYFTSAANSTVLLVNIFCSIFRRKHIHRTAHENDCNGEYVKDYGLMGKFYLLGLKRANVVLTQTKQHQVQLQDNYGIRAVLFPNSFNIVGSFELERREYILWVARFEKWKNPDIFVDIAEKIPNEKFLMICPGNENDLDYIKFRQKAMAVPNLKFIGLVKFKEITDYYRKAKVFINTSEKEGFPNTFLQSGAVGTPVISYMVNPDQVIEKDDLGFFCFGNIAVLVKRLRQILADKNLWHKKSDNIMKYVATRHSLESNLSMLKSIISELS